MARPYQTANSQGIKIKKMKDSGGVKPPSFYHEQEYCTVSPFSNMALHQSIASLSCALYSFTCSYWNCCPQKKPSGAKQE